MQRSFFGFRRKERILSIFLENLVVSFQNGLILCRGKRFYRK